MTKPFLDLRGGDSDEALVRQDLGDVGAPGQPQVNPTAVGSSEEVESGAPTSVEDTGQQREQIARIIEGHNRGNQEHPEPTDWAYDAADRIITLRSPDVQPAEPESRNIAIELVSWGDIVGGGIEATVNIPPGQRLDDVIDGDGNVCVLLQPTEER